MNQKAFKSILSFYKKNFDKIEKQEIYKWKAVQIFRDNWDMEAENFTDMLNRSLSGTRNLMSAGNYYPRRTILWMSEKDSDAVRSMFRDFYDLSKDFKNIIYTKYYETEPEKLESVYLVKPKKFTYKAVKTPIELKGEFIDYIEIEKKFKQIGDMGEQFIFFQEREKVKQYNLPKNKKVVWVSRDMGDGL